MQPGTFQNGASNEPGASLSNGSHRAQHDGALDPTPSTSKLSSRTIYPGSHIDREELVRLTVQCLQDAGYQ